MSNKLDCHVVKDLLPLYADGLTGEETSRDIKDHLDECKNCRAQFLAMTGQLAGEEQAEKEREDKEIDYLKKVKKHSKRAAVIIACAALLVIAVLGWRFFIRGSADGRQEISAEVEGSRTVHLNARTTGSSLAISGIDVFEDNGTLTVCARTVPAGLRRNDSCSKTYTASSDIKQIFDGEAKVIWENGTSIEPYVSNMFAKKVKYVGDAPAVSRLVNAVTYPGMWELGLEGGVELQTASQPYGLILKCRANNFVSKEVLTKHASLLLALIENLDYVEYRLQLDEASYTTVRVTSEDALAFAHEQAAFGYESRTAAEEEILKAKSIKDLGKSALSLQMLAEMFKYSKSIYTSQ